jgi:hypothetical protein
MKSLIFGGAIVATTGALTVLFGTGFDIATAAADSYAGQSYSDATSAISGAGQKSVIASRVGDTASPDDCVVTRSQSAPWIKGDSFAPVTDTVLLYLNCNAKVASAISPGNSLASPEGRAEKAAEAQAAAQQNETDQLAGTDQSVAAPGAHH